MSRAASIYRGATLYLESASAYLPEASEGLVQEARELYRSEGERPWGVDIAAAFAYYFQRGLWRASGTAATASVSGRR